MPPIFTKSFRSLKLPKHITDSSATVWYVQAVFEDIYLINDRHGILGTVGVPMKQFYFDSEAEALEEMLIYYNFHNESFPYIDEYRLAKNMPAAGTRKGVLTSDKQSQTMEFE